MWINGTGICVNAAIVGLSADIKQAMIGLPHWCKNMMPRKSKTLYKKKLIQ